MRIVETLKRKTVDVRERAFIIICSSLFWGIFAHGMMIFNKFSFHDDIAVFFGTSGIKGGVSQGRWMCGLYGTLLSGLFGHDFSIPLYKGLVSFLFIGIAWILISDLMELKNKFGLIAVSGILVVISSITSIFGYIYMALYYTFGLLLSVSGSYLVCKGRKLFNYCMGSVLIVCAVGTYQLFFAAAICVMLLFMYKEVVDRKCDIKEFVLSSLRLLGIAIICLAVYMVITKLVCAISGIPLTNYKNIDKMGLVEIDEYISRAKTAYGAFINPNRYVCDIPYPNASIILYHILVGFLLFTIALYFISFFREHNWQAAIEIVLLTSILPIALNLVFLLSGDSGVIQFYCHVFLYILLLFLVERIARNMYKTGKWYVGCAIGFILILNLSFCRFSNACYLKAELLQEHAISYFNELGTRIHSVEGYTNDTQIAWIAPREKRDVNSVPQQFDGIRLAPYGVETIINDYQWTSFMWIWTGYVFQVSEKDFSDRPEVKLMPTYPDDGSIKMIDGVIVVKFGVQEN